LVGTTVTAGFFPVALVTGAGAFPDIFFAGAVAYLVAFLIV